MVILDRWRREEEGGWECIYKCEIEWNIMLPDRVQ
jgi:hypothetical protein